MPKLTILAPRCRISSHKLASGYSAQPRMIRALSRTIQPAQATWLHPTPLRFLHLADMSRRSGRLSASSVPSTSSPSLVSTRASSSKAFVPTPYFEEWRTDALQAEVKRYGFKVSRKRATLIDQLKAVYAALERSDAAFEPPQHPLPADGDAVQDGTPPPEPARKRKLILPTYAESGAGGKGKGKGRGRKRDPFVLDASSDSAPSSQPEPSGEQGVADEPGDLTAQLEREALSPPTAAATQRLCRLGRPTLGLSVAREAEKQAVSFGQKLVVRRYPASHTPSR